MQQVFRLLPFFLARLLLGFGAFLELGDGLGRRVLGGDLGATVHDEQEEQERPHRAEEDREKGEGRDFKFRAWPPHETSRFVDPWQFRGAQPVRRRAR